MKDRKEERPKGSNIRGINVDFWVFYYSPNIPASRQDIIQKLAPKTIKHERFKATTQREIRFFTLLFLRSLRKLELLFAQLHITLPVCSLKEKVQL